MIPRIIHQIWIGPNRRPADLMETWRRLNPSFAYELWDDARCASFGFQNASKIAEQPEFAGKADLIRYEILRRHGGVYVDADSECVRPLEDGMLIHDSFACWENERVRPGLISNGTLGTTASNELMGLLIQEAGRRDMTAARAWITVGPMLLTQTVMMNRYTELFIYPSHYFLPEHHTGLVYEGSGPVFARQHWGSTKGLYASTSGLFKG